MTQSFDLAFRKYICSDLFRIDTILLVKRYITYRVIYEYEIYVSYRERRHSKDGGL